MKCFLASWARTQGSYTTAFLNYSDAHPVFTAVALVGGFFLKGSLILSHESSWQALCAEVLSAILCLFSSVVNNSFKFFS